MGDAGCCNHHRSGPRCSSPLSPSVAGTAVSIVPVVPWTSDLHLGHANIIRYCDRPFADVREMNDELIRRWNETVSSDDEVWVLGDVALYQGDSHDDRRFVGQRPADAGLVLLHGHVHERWKVNGRQVNVGVDVWDYRPVSDAQILSALTDTGVTPGLATAER